MKKALFFIAIFLPLIGRASSESHGSVAHGLDENTIRQIIYQAINVGIIVVALVYYLKDMVRGYFTQKHVSFLQAAEKAQAARKQAEDEHMQIKIQLTKLESTADESISRARAEAVDMKHQLIAEAKLLSKRISEDAEASARLEVEKAKVSLREQIIRDAASVAHKNLSENVTTEDHARLQNDFIQNIGAVRP